MKSLSSIFFIWLTITSTLLISHCTDTNEAKSSKPAITGISQTTNLSVTTIRCNDCLNTIRRNLLALDGVIAVKVLLKEKDNVIVTFEPQKISENALKIELRNTGHQVE